MILVIFKCLAVPQFGLEMSLEHQTSFTERIERLFNRQKSMKVSGASEYEGVIFEKSQNWSKSSKSSIFTDFH